MKGGFPITSYYLPILWQRRVGVVDQVKRHFGEPGTGSRVDATPFGIDGRSSSPKATRAFTIGLAGDLDPQVGIHQG